MSDYMPENEEAKPFDFLSLQEATAFFAELYGGEHHIPGFKVHPFGRGWMVKHDRGDLATYDYNELTKLVLMAHDKCYRASVAPGSTRMVKIAIWKRKREGSISHRHPTIEDAITSFRPSNPLTNGK